MMDRAEYHRIKLSVDSSKEGVVTVFLDGYLETENSDYCLKFISGIIDASPSNIELVLAMADLCYVSSTGIGVLTTILVNSRKKNLKLILENMQPKVKSVMDLLGFSSFFIFR